MQPTVLRPRLQRLVERINASVLPLVLVPRLARQGELRRWELRVLTPAKPFAGWRIPLSLWRRGRAGWSPRRGARVLPFQHPQWASGPLLSGRDLHENDVTPEDMRVVLERRAG